MKITLPLVAGIIAATTGFAAPSAAEPPVNIDDTGHIHHVWLGDGTCHEIDAVGWDIADNGMHRGANASGTTQGPWHGPCPWVRLDLSPCRSVASQVDLRTFARCR